MKTKITFISCIFALIMSAAALWAQEAPTSPQNEATAGRASTEVDQFMSPTDWGNVSFDKVFTYVGYAHKKSNYIDLGAAFKAGSIYIGSWYKGDLGSFTRPETTNKQTVNTTVTLGKDAAAGTVANTKRVTNTWLDKQYEAEHTAAVLLGFGNMGVQFGYKRNMPNGDDGVKASMNKSGKYYNGAAINDEVTTNTRDESVNKTTYSNKGFVTNTNQTPFVAFGMNVPFGAMTVSPTVALGITIHQEGQYGEKTEETKSNKTDAASYRYSTTKDVNGTNNKSYVGIAGKVGAGFALSDSLNSSFGIEYTFDVHAHGKTYKALSGEKHKVRGWYEITTDSVSDKYNESGAGTQVNTKIFDATMTAKSYFSNTLKPSYSIQKDFNDRIALFAGLECPVTVTIDNSVVTKEYKSVTVTKYIDEQNSYKNTTETEVRTEPKTTTNITTVTVEPAATAAITYAAIPNRLSLNLGTEIKFLKGTHKYTKTSKDGVIKATKKTTKYDNQNGREVVKDSFVSVDATETVSKNATQEKVKVKLSGGLKWNIAENFAFDVVYNQSLLDGINWSKAFGDVKLACTIKF